MGRFKNWVMADGSRQEGAPPRGGRRQIRQPAKQTQGPGKGAVGMGNSDS